MLMTTLAPVPRRTLTESCADRLRHAIVDGELPPGNRLPPEQELADRLAVSRLTLRSALIRLVGEGLVEARHGSGYTVRDFRESAGSALLPSVVEVAREHGHAHDVVADLLRVRRHLAAALLERVQDQPPAPEAVEAVQDAVDAFAARVAEGAAVEAIAEADSDVLAAILAASGSVVLQLSLHPVREVLRASPRLCRAMYGDPAGNLLGWRALVAWLASPVGRIAPLVQLLAARDDETLRAFAALPEDR
jgi:GntR family transcriptional repressor for pyruvate dehydrogenase complex